MKTKLRKKRTSSLLSDNIPILKKRYSESMSYSICKQNSEPLVENKIYRSDCYWHIPAYYDPSLH